MVDEQLIEECESNIKRVVTEEDKPIMSSSVSIREEVEEDGKFILFNAENDFILVVNGTGKFILEGCNGERTINDIAQLIRSEYTIQDDSVNMSHMVKDFVQRMSNAALVVFEGEV